MPNYPKLQGLLNRIMYHDTATVYRLTKSLDDDGSDDYSEEETEVYVDMPCKLSQYNKDLSQDRTAKAVNLTINLRLCCDPSYTILENDIIKITHNGQNFVMNAGKRFVYPTHQEIPMKQVKEAGSGYNN